MYFACAMNNMLLSKICLICSTILFALCYCSEPRSEAKLAHRIFELLHNLSYNRFQLDGSAKFSLLLGEFLIKQKIRYMNLTEFEIKIYYHLLHKMDVINNSSQIQRVRKTEKQILANVFQNHILLLSPSLKHGLIHTNADYEELAINYENFLKKGRPNRTQSDFCMKNIVSLGFNNCQLNSECLEILTSESPSYGYQRTHQVLLLYILQHHKCSSYFFTTYMYDLMAKKYCNNVDREQDAIRSLQLPKQYRDLYLEQAVICGLHGYSEFVNWRNIVEIDSWLDENIHCHDDVKIETYHLNDLALVFYINALLLL